MFSNKFHQFSIGRFELVQTDCGRASKDFPSDIGEDTIVKGGLRYHSIVPVIRRVYK